LLLGVRDLTGRKPHVYFGWAERSPAADPLRSLLLGEGEVVPLTREVLREGEGRHMLDVVYVLLTVALFAGLAAAVRAVERL
jgi:hypothetical protein